MLRFGQEVRVGGDTSVKVLPKIVILGRMGEGYSGQTFAACCWPLGWICVHSR